MLHTIPNNQNKQSGQTLIETMVAVFILVMGIVAALALANYSLGVTGHIRQETIALGLAREGIEVVKNMRDVNWLQGTLYTDCYDFLQPGTSDGYCYKDWLTGPAYNLSDGTYYLSFVGGKWTLVPETTAFSISYDPTASGGSGVFYNSTGDVVGTDNATFARKITIAKDNTFTPFDKDTGPRVKITSEVWWAEKRCPITDDPGPNNPCKITLTTYLTNWRNF